MIKPILQVEDSDGDARLLELVFRKAGVTNQIITVPNGDEAICYFKGEGPYADRSKFPLPGVLLLDLKLPGTGGFEVLEWMKAHPAFKEMLILVITGQQELGQVNRAYALGARSFLTKPFNEQDVANITKAFGGYWSFRQP
jgi:CheY-like chemotaxis protein